MKLSIRLAQIFLLVLVIATAAGSQEGTPRRRGPKQICGCVQTYISDTIRLYNKNVTTDLSDDGPLAKELEMLLLEFRMCLDNSSDDYEFKEKIRLVVRKYLDTIKGHRKGLPPVPGPRPLAAEWIILDEAKKVKSVCPQVKLPRALPGL